MDNFWDRRYSEPGFAYGRQPNDFFRQVIDGLQPGKLLLPGEGEGRNAVYAAGRGWEVLALDQSRVAKEKAMEWAESKGITITYDVSDLNQYLCAGMEFDLVALVYLHFPARDRQKIHRQLASCIKPGGMILMECFHKTQLDYDTGGPRAEELLYVEEDLLEDFNMLEVEQCEQMIINVLEGKYHTGKASVIRFKAKKPHP